VAMLNQIQDHIHFGFSQTTSISQTNTTNVCQILFEHTQEKVWQNSNIFLFRPLHQTPCVQISGKYKLSNTQHILD
jgi:hypothetical protein